jgi:uncharacterized membrane protein YdjX (TVP38/TMEM64 family)
MNRKSLLPRLVLLALIAAGIALWVVYREQLSPERVEAWIGSLGIWGPLVYILAYLAAPSLFFPGAVITLAGGALFGPVWGTLYVVIGSVGGATAAFLVARYLAGEWVERKASGMLRQVKEGVEAEGWRFVAFVRLVPLFPFNLLNYVLGLTRVRLRTYVLTSAVCMFPGTVGYVYLGYVGREVAAGGADRLGKVLWGIGVFAALVFIPVMVRHWRARGGRSTGALAETPGSPDA